MKPIKDPTKLTPYKCRHSFEPMSEEVCMSGTKHKLPNIAKMKNTVTKKRVAPKTMSLARELASNQFVIGSGRRKHALQHTYPTRNPQINAAIVDVAINHQDHCGCVPDRTLIRRVFLSSSLDQIRFVDSGGEVGPFVVWSNPDQLAFLVLRSVRLPAPVSANDKSH